MDAMRLVPDNSMLAPDPGDGPQFEVRVWHEDDFRRQAKFGVAGIHLVFGPVVREAPLAREAAALYAGISSGKVSLVLQVASVPAAAPMRELSRGGLTPRALRRVREHVETRLAEKIDLSTMSALTGLSATHFARAFKQSVGVPPARYVRSRRVEAAAKLIERTDLPLAEIALEVGFSDQSHFTRTFAEMTGDTPRAYRRKRR